MACRSGNVVNVFSWGNSGKKVRATVLSGSGTEIVKGDLNGESVSFQLSKACNKAAVVLELVEADS